MSEVAITVGPDCTGFEKGGLYMVESVVGGTVCFRYIGSAYQKAPEIGRMRRLIRMVRETLIRWRQT